MHRVVNCHSSELHSHVGRIIKGFDCLVRRNKLAQILIGGERRIWIRDLSPSLPPAVKFLTKAFVISKGRVKEEGSVTYSAYLRARRMDENGEWTRMENGVGADPPDSVTFFPQRARAAPSFLPSFLPPQKES